MGADALLVKCRQRTWGHPPKAGGLHPAGGVGEAQATVQRRQEPSSHALHDVASNHDCNQSIELREETRADLLRPENTGVAWLHIHPMLPR